jgi:hypothetical protein
VVREEGELTQSHNWVLPLPSYCRDRETIQRWTGVLQNPVNLARWYKELFGEFGEAVEPEEQSAVESAVESADEAAIMAEQSGSDSK